jgi:hypothetical protein
LAAAGTVQAAMTLPRINQLTKQLTKATQQLKELGLSDADEKKNSRSYSNPR